MTSQKIFLDGKIVQAEASLVSTLAPGAVRGAGAFETMRVYDGTILFLEAHRRRLARGLRLLKVRQPQSGECFTRHLGRLIRINGINRGGIRLAVWKEGRLVRSAMACLDVEYPQGRYQTGFAAAITEAPRRLTRFSNVKSLDYAFFRQASDQARELGADEAILLNTRGEIVEGSRTNIFYVQKGALYTPAVCCGCLNGITRQIVLTCARRAGIFGAAVSACPADLFRAQEAFVTNALMGVMPLTAIDRRPIGSGKVGPMTLVLSELYRRIVLAYVQNYRHET